MALRELRRALIGLVLLLGSVVPVAAGTFAEGIAAKEAGDLTKAASIMRELADKGDPVAAYNAGLAYANGQGVERDDGTAASLFRKSAEAGYDKGQLLLGIMYSYGRGVKADPAEADKWYALAADQGNPNAQFSLANAFMNGTGVTKDQGKADVWLRRAAAQGYPNAMVTLGAALADGAGAEKDLVGSYTWLSLAMDAVDGDKPKALTKALREEIAKHMTPEQIASAETRVKDFKPVGENSETSHKTEAAPK
ncbi:TPR repeat protein [Bradyrhizobium sp. USDA 4341]